MRYAAVVVRRALQRLQDDHIVARARARLVHLQSRPARILTVVRRTAAAAPAALPPVAPGAIEVGSGANDHPEILRPVDVGAHHMSRVERLGYAADKRVRRASLGRVEHPVRLIPVAAGSLLLVAAILASSPLASPSSARGGSGLTYGPRLVVQGLDDRISASRVGGLLTPSPLAPASASVPAASAASGAGGLAQFGVPELAAPSSAPISLYTVVAGDTLTGVARRFGVSATTIYWANVNRLPDPAALHLGQQLVIPAANGLVIVVQASDTLESLALRYEVTVEAIAQANQLGAAGILIGQTIVIPGVSGGPIPTPTPTPAPATPKPAVKKVTTATSTASYTARLAWPLPGGRISQRYSAGHPAIDIAAPYGKAVYAAAAGTVVFAGWRSYSGGGNVVWIRHTSGLYTTYNHLSAWSVRVGQTVARGQRVGSVGTSGIATGPHLHFEVWTRYPWAGGSSAGLVNPCRYLGC